MVPLVRSVISIPAGASEMPIARFCLLTGAGSLLWNSVLIGAGVAVGSRWEAVAAVAGTYSTAVVLALATATVALTAVYAVRRRSRRT